MHTHTHIHYTYAPLTIAFAAASLASRLCSADPMADAGMLR